MLFVMMIHRIKMLKECPYWWCLFCLPFGACSRWIPAAQRNW